MSNDPHNFYARLASGIEAEERRLHKDPMILKHPPTAATPAPLTSPEEIMARRFHDAYEKLAPSFGYNTRQETREFDPDSPNGRLMMAVCAEVMDELDAERLAALQLLNEGWRASARLIKATSKVARMMVPNPQPTLNDEIKPYDPG